jgi:hypothetical protein
VGVDYACLIEGRLGFAYGSRRVVADRSEMPPETLPWCLEPVGTPAAPLVGDEQ